MWEQLAAKKRLSTYNRIPHDWIVPSSTLAEAKGRRDITGPFIDKLLAEEERAITVYPAAMLVELIADSSYTALEVTRAFCKRAAIAHQLNNCLHEIFFDDALKRAKELDEYLGKTGKVVGPLHGLPVSLKDQFHVKNVETTMGYVGWIGSFEGQKGTGQELNVESQLVSELRALGAVLYCKTSLPQTLLVGETINNVIGRTMNPVNQLLSCGGSSGGEGALQALRGSSVGVGTDIGGSVRIPAAFCGIYAIKPSFGRFSYNNVANSCPGQTIMPSTIGFLATSLLSLQLIMTALLSTKPWLKDPDVVELPWRSANTTIAEKRLCFAIFPNDGKVKPHPPIARSLQIVVNAIEKAGHEVVVWEPPSHVEAWEIHASFILADGGANVWEQLELSQEPLIPELHEIFDDKPHEPASLFEYQDNALKRRHYLTKYMEYWNSTADKSGTGRTVDAVILPVAPHAAVLPGEYFHYGYSDFIDLLDYTSIVIPVTRADKNLDPFDKSYQPMNDIDDKNWKAYNPEIYDGAPVGLQLMGRRFDEERMIGIASLVVDAMVRVDTD